MKKGGEKKYKLLGFPSIFWVIILFFLFRQGIRITKEKRDEKPKDNIGNWYIKDNQLWLKDTTFMHNINKDSFDLLFEQYDYIPQSETKEEEYKPNL